MSKYSITDTDKELHIVDQNEHKENSNKLDITPDNPVISADFWSSPPPDSLKYMPARFHRLWKFLGLPEGKRRFNRAD